VPTPHPSRYPIARTRLQAGGDFAYAEVPQEYDGPCELRCAGAKGSNAAVFPTKTEAFAAAAYAIQPDGGGYSDVLVVDAPDKPPTHQDWVQWAFGGSVCTPAVRS
jgi:hypothetical protein